MADEVLLQPDQAHARQEVGVTDNHPVVALLPGSRASEIAQMLPLFMQTFATVKAQLPSLQAIIPAVNDARETQIRALCASSEFGDDVLITRTDPRQVMIASDFVLLTSGTATLEAMLCKKPMLSAYKMSALTYWMMKRLYQPKYFSLPNILANEALLPELLQEDVKPQVMADYMMSILTTTPLPHSYTPTVQGSTMTPASAQHICYQQQRFVEIHQQLQRNASQQATKVVIQMLGQAC
jgi:lipid-A-disaccharide synthase